jgi:hypothetical protein
MFIEMQIKKKEELNYLFMEKTQRFRVKHGMTAEYFRNFINLITNLSFSNENIKKLS